MSTRASRRTVTPPDSSSLKDGLLTASPQLGAGVHDGISAVLADKAGFDFLWLGSFSTSAAFGLPDVGLLDVSDVVALVAAARRLTAIPIVVDMEAGYGDAVRAFYAARALSSAGATAVCIEDNHGARRCSLYDGYLRTLADVPGHCAKITAIREALRPLGGAVVARTEAIVAGLGVDEAVRRCEAYVAAGAEAVFVQSVAADGPDDLLSFCMRWARHVPVFIAPTRYEEIACSVFYDAGATHYIYANQALRAAHRAISEVYGKLRATGTLQGLETPLSAVSEVAADVGEEAVRRIQSLPPSGEPATHDLATSIPRR